MVQTPVESATFIYENFSLNRMRPEKVFHSFLKKDLNMPCGLVKTITSFNLSYTKNCRFLIFGITPKKELLVTLCAVVAERLRRLNCNQIPYGSAGSNPANCV